MKRTFVKIVSKKFLTVAAIVALFIVATATNAKAGETKPESNLSAVEFAGTVNDNVAFNIKYANETGADFYLVVKNESGEIIYAHTFSNKNFSKKFVIKEVPEEGGNVTFIIRNGGADLKQTFNISNTTTSVSDVVVTAAK
jgi:hypothetical protein